MLGGTNHFTIQFIWHVRPQYEASPTLARSLQARWPGCLKAGQWNWRLHSPDLNVRWLLCGDPGVTTFCSSVRKIKDVGGSKHVDWFDTQNISWPFACPLLAIAWFFLRKARSSTSGKSFRHLVVLNGDLIQELIQWKFQDLKMEGLYHKAMFYGAYSPTEALHRHYKW